jgi:hypothetical protein
LLPASFQFVSELLEGTFNFFLGHADKVMHYAGRCKISLTKIQFMNWGPGPSNLARMRLGL